MCAVDINKAYDAVDRHAMDKILTHMGIADVSFVRFLRKVLDDGPTVVTGAPTLSTPFYTTRGIKQGCPASPTLFGLLLAGL